MSSFTEAKTTGEKAEMIEGMKKGDKFSITWGHRSLYIDKATLDIKVRELKNLKLSRYDGGTIYIEEIKDE
tara:strand:- start:275 stop:487 length:213 start_codon:yes stop_codon:yes gene_type:complete